MHRTPIRTTTRLLAIALALIASAALVACGSSSGGNGTTATTTANAAAGTSTTGTAPGGAAKGRFGARFSALRECLKKDGIELPQRKPGSKPSGGRPAGGFFLGGGALPKGVTRSQFEAALKKCGGSSSFGRFGSRARFGGANFRKSLTKFAECMRKNGIDVPAPNTSGNGPIFNTKGIDTASSKFREAQRKCSSLLRSNAGPGGVPGAGGPGGGAPPAGGEPTG